MEAKRQREELAQISREMRSPITKTAIIWGILSLVLLCVLCGAGYCFWCLVTVGGPRKDFMDAYATAKLDEIKRYAPAMLVRVEKLKESAERGSTFVEARTVSKDYREARVVLMDARSKAHEERKNYETVKERFDKLYEEAEGRELSKYAPDIWQRIQDLADQARSETDSTFASAHAVDKLGEAIEDLERTRESLHAIKSFKEAESGFLELNKQIVPGEWSRILPDEYASLKGTVSRAEAAERSGNWESAAKEYQAAVAIATPALATIIAKRDAAKAVLDSFSKTLEATDTEDLSTNDPDSWSAIRKAQETLQEAFDSHNYDEMTASTDANVKLVAEAIERVKIAKTTRDDRVKELVDTYAKASEHSRFFRMNWRKEWTAIETNYRQVPELVKAGEYVRLLNAVEALKAKLDALIERREKILAETTKAREALVQLEKDAAMPLLDANLPAEVQKYGFRKNGAVRAERRGSLTDAVDLYGEAYAVLDDALKQAKALRDESRRLALECRSRRDDYDRGIRLFRVDSLREIADCMTRAASHLGQKQYSHAYPLLKHLDELLPEARFTFEHEGTVVDNEMGVMWARDGNGPGCYDGKQCDWATAYEWARSLEFAGLSDWRLPTYDELQVLLRMPTAERNRVFVNTRISVYWSGTYDTVTDLDRMLAADFDTNRNVKKHKRQELYVRAIRSPR